MLSFFFFGEGQEEYKGGLWGRGVGLWGMWLLDIHFNELSVRNRKLSAIGGGSGVLKGVLDVRESCWAGFFSFLFPFIYFFLSKVFHRAEREQRSIPLGFFSFFLFFPFFFLVAWELTADSIGL